MHIQHTRISNGASVSTYRGSLPGQHRVVFAGQHGQEVGPIAALLGWQPRVSSGIVTVVRCANPYGADIGFRFYQGPGGENLDMNRGWHCGGQEVCCEFVDAIMDGADQEPNEVLDLHASAEASLGLGILMPSSARSTARRVAEMANDVLGCMDAVEPGWRILTTNNPGGLADESERLWGAAAITIEFASDAPAHEPMVPPWEARQLIQQRDADPRRKRTLVERTRGVLELVEHFVRGNRSE